ncbi:glycosyltransferase family 4 protein [Empedobacter sp. GD03861]|uniref:glycosyltransferase n=1 Tax=Empedobacter sp. GD03861 TaxID=2975390 RepID=UPI0024493759|nr:glycosyltransferase [Empedobacter sp. GD03861]MDH0673400.1 glycosyltransferase family 4 protein [Empedobacter sp. GD03861]
MKVLFIHDHKFIKKENLIYTTGGLPSTVWQNYIINDQINLTVFGRINNTLKSDTLSSYENVEFVFSKYYNNPKDFFIHKSKIKSELKKLIDDHDKIIIRLPSFLGLIASEICINEGKTFYSEVVANGYDSLYNYNLFGKFLANYYHYKSKKSISKSSYALYVTKDYLQKVYPCKNITDYASDVEISENHNKIEFKSVAPKKTFICGTVGNLEVKFKGYEIFFKSLKLLKKDGYNIKYKIAGAGNSAYLHNLAVKYGIEDEVEFIGKLDRIQIETFYKSLDLYIHPSFQEGLPRVVVEAMNFDNVILASTIGGIPELINERFLHKPGDFRKLYEDFKLITNNEELFNEEIVRNRETVKKYQRETLIAKRRNFLIKYLYE